MLMMIIMKVTVTVMAIMMSWSTMLHVYSHLGSTLARVTYKKPHPSRPLSPNNPTAMSSVYSISNFGFQTVFYTISSALLVYMCV